MSVMGWEKSRGKSVLWWCICVGGGDRERILIFPPQKSKDADIFAHLYDI